MQVVSAPTRAELVRAHSRRVWLHIGVPSLRNLRYISRARALVWFALFLSSVPLHLLFNSVIFTNMQANDYYVFSVTQAWLDGPGYNDSTTTRMNLTTVEIASPGWLEHALKDSIAPHLRLSTADCFDTYDDHYVSRAGTVYIVQDGIIATVGSKETPDENTPTDWRCRDKEQPCEVSKDKSDWRLDDAPIEYCIVEEVEERCRLDFSFVIASLVIVSNFTKAICMALIIFKYRRHSPLVTLGDTVAHFLDFPDPETKGRCLFSRRLMDAQWTWEFSNGANKDELGVDPERYIPKHWRWQTAPSAYRWSSTYIMYAVTLIFGMVFMARSLASMPRDQARRWDFGAIDGKNVLRMNTSLMGAILLANLPQAILSYLYLTFNALYTNMFVAREWSTYGGERKPLRVTSPVGQQRDTYWLNVPFRWAIPMTILSGLFHWLASQSIFLVQITITATQDRQVTRLMSTCGYSAVAIILCIVVGTIVAIGGLVIGRFKYVSAMPMASSCSAAISAACHPLPEDAHASTLPVQWGVVARGDRYTEGDKAVGHCAFSSLPVQQPIQGRLYA
ncbi:hypothetical protein T440DRAFT_405013 [Plenodomus tracheiphilus IPT5]|uniref:DUF6536 domain-containing protein n=1 Tax=Plenodomus tracheiphilus IPT5 TaxID=1408161 RepID=A0A6A7AX35_9PLEO|nr:hypothetical protein T440DRAFT_405013 [Plenodomus tracheiphilus IPT5]